MRKRGSSDEGSVLLSTFYLLLFMSFLIISLTSIVRLQVLQLQQISQSYEAKALIEMGEAILKEKVEREDVETGKIIFREGVVDVKKETGTTYTLVVTLSNQYTSRSTIDLLLPEDTEDVEGLETDEDIIPDVSGDEDTKEKGPPVSEDQ